MKLEVVRWQTVTPPTEEELREIYRREGLSPHAWANAPRDVYSPHAHSYDKVLFVVRGSIIWILPDRGEEIETFPGDRLDLPRHTMHAARVGSNGVICLEAHLD